MKFCLSSRQTDEYLKQADEIRVQHRDYRQIYDLFDKFLDATIILNCQNFTDEKFVKALKEFVVLAPNRLILSLFSYEDLDTAKEFSVPYYIIHPVQTLDQLYALKDLGVCYALLDNQVIHQLHEAKIVGVPLRAIPNIAHLDGIPRVNGITGNWIRPEDLDAYSIYIDALEFGSQPERREQALFRIYKNEHSFPGELSRIVQDLNELGENMYLNSEWTQQRMNCGMTCSSSKNCTLCYDIFKIISHPELFEN